MSKKVEKKTTVLGDSKTEDKPPKPVVPKPVSKQVSAPPPTDETVTITKTEYEDLKKELAEIKTIVKGFKKELKGLVEIQQRLVHERLGAPVPLPPKEYGEETSSASIGIELSSTSDDRIKITGKRSFDIKETIKQSAPSKAKFSAADKSWSIPSEYLDALITNLEALNLVKGKDFSVNVSNGGNTSKKEDNDSEPDEGGFGSGFI